MKTAKKWIQGAKLKKGAFSAKAKRSGSKVQTYATKVLNNPKKFTKKTVKQARLAKTFKKMSKKK